MTHCTGYASDLITQVNLEDNYESRSVSKGPGNSYPGKFWLISWAKQTLSHYEGFIFWLPPVLFSLFLLAACDRSVPPPLEPLPTLVETAFVPTQKPISSLVPALTVSIPSTSSNEATPTIVTPWSSPTATPGRTPVPDDSQVYYHQIQDGETLTGIAIIYGIDLEYLIYTNDSLDPELPLPGQLLQIPTGGAYVVQQGNTMMGIATLFNMSPEDLLRANEGRLDPDNLLIRPGDILLIPPPWSVTTGCDPVPERVGVITYTLQSSEGLLCLALKFQLQIVTILSANPQVGRQVVIIPPADGALYTITADDINRGTTLMDIAAWYDVSEDDILDWNGDQVTDLSVPGISLFIRGADLLAGDFNSAFWFSFPP